VEAKVDIRKLQLLNDRIAQVTDALNQVRLSVHGLSHTAASIGQPGWGVPFGAFQPFGALQQPVFGFPQGIPYGLGQQTGFQHTPYYPGVPAFGQVPWQSGLPSPIMGAMGAAPVGAQAPWQTGLPTPFAGGYGTGIPSGQQIPWQSGLQSPMAGAFGLQHTGAYGQAPYGVGLPGIAGAGFYQRPELTEQRLIEQSASDPNHILQTFPFCQSPVSAVAW